MSGDFTDDDAPVTLPERLRVTATSDGDEATRRTVHCPVRGGAQTVEHCRGCPRFDSEAGEAVHCHVPASVLKPKRVLGELLPRVSVVLDGEVGVEAAARMLEGQRLGGAPVVDDNHIAVGVVGRAELDRSRVYDAHLHGLHRSEVEDAMTGELVTFREDAELREVARVMAQKRLTLVTVVDARGEVVGAVDVHAVLEALLQER